MGQGVGLGDVNKGNPTQMIQNDSKVGIKPPKYSGEKPPQWRVWPGKSSNKNPLDLDGVLGVNTVFFSSGITAYANQPTIGPLGLEYLKKLDPKKKKGRKQIHWYLSSVG